MLKYPCLVLDHDETVVQSEKTIGYPCFCHTLSRLRPEQSITVEEYVRGCHDLGFVDMCRKVYGFSEEELLEEYPFLLYPLPKGLLYCLLFLLNKTLIAF